jgi:hypothetical protein
MSSPRPVLPPPWSPDRRSYLFVAVLPPTGGMADPRPPVAATPGAAAGATSKGGGARAASRPAAARPPPPSVTQSPGAAVLGFLQPQQLPSGLQHNQQLFQQQEEAQATGAGRALPASDSAVPTHRAAAVPSVAAPFKETWPAGLYPASSPSVHAATPFCSTKFPATATIVSSAVVWSVPTTTVCASNHSGSGAGWVKKQV